MALHWIDWLIISLYLIAMIGLSVFLSRGQKNAKDYYLGGNTTGAFPIAISTMATQCSTNSILGAPAFVAFSIGGGLVWLQYEIALPFAMIFLMIFLMPIYRHLNIISVYAYLEKRFNKATRTLISLVFQFMRAFVTGVTVYGISLVISYCTGVSFATSVVMLAIITIIYDSIGGMKAVIYSDVIQMAVLFTAILFTIAIALNINGGFSETLAAFSNERQVALNFDSWGFDGNAFGFWPMLFGGFFLYISYYGCDQTQVQRELSTKSVDGTNWSLFINGVLRFPLVLTYCFLGVCIGAYAIKNPDFLNLLPLENGSPNYNLSVPVFVIKYFPIGAIGLFMVGLFSAAMSSLDSTINSLSATTLQDILKNWLNLDLSNKQELWASKGLTVFWGATCSIFAFYVGDISDSIIESINKIGSLLNGPILGIFLLGVLTKRVQATPALFGFFCSFILNALIWKFAPNIAWPWWNVIGCIACFAVGLISSYLLPASKSLVDNNHELTYLGVKQNNTIAYQVHWPRYYKILVFYGILIIGVCFAISL